MFSDLAFKGDPRKTFTFRHVSGKMPYRSAAEALLHRTGTVFLVTGFYVKEAGTIETDGITGTWSLFKTLTELGNNVIIPVDEAGEPVLKHLFPEENLIFFGTEPPETSMERAREIQKTFNPHAVIAIERPGPGADGRYRNCRGEDISDHVARMDTLFGPPAMTIAIGDGGNELGMGRLAKHLAETGDTRPVCPIPADITLIGAASDFAAWGLVAALEAVARKPVFPDPAEITEMLHYLERLGAVDGMFVEPAATIDGFSIQQISDILHGFRNAARQLRLAGLAVDDIVLDQTGKYGVATIDVTPRYLQESTAINLSGTVLLDAQATALADACHANDLTVAALPEILSDPECRHERIRWMAAGSTPVDLRDRPAGRFITQILPTDSWVRILWTYHDWLLIQTPDLALGWCRWDTIASHIQAQVTASPWENLKRAPADATVSDVLSLHNLIRSADSLQDAPYRWGGRSPDGIDCSGMIQCMFTDQNILLPRNSRQQRRCGIRVKPGTQQPGDLIFAVGRTRTLHHVGICLPGSIQHACLNAGRVVRESMDDFAEKYRMIGVRRIAYFD